MYKRISLVASAMLSTERPPAALAVLAGICEANNIEYTTFDLNIFIIDYFGFDRWDEIAVLTSGSEIKATGQQLEEINQAAMAAANKIIESNPDLIALTSFSSLQIAWTAKILEHLRKVTDITIIAGGPGISYEQDTNKTAGKILAENNLLDYYVLGEGDLVFEKFLKGQIEFGVNSKESKFENWVPQIDNLDDLTLPSYKNIDISKYHSLLENNAFAVTITGSRGCIRRCSFCDVGHLWKKFRFRSAKSVASEIVKHYNDVGCLNYMFSDSLINGSLKQFIELMEELVKLQSRYPDFKNIKYSGHFIVRPKKHHPEYMYQLMKESGCDQIAVGIESGSERVREHLGKKFSNEDIDYHLEMCEKYNIKNTILMITAYPTETIEDHQMNVDFYIKNQKYIINDTIISTVVNNPMMILKNTPIYNMKDDLGIIIHNAQYENVSNWTISTNPELNMKERWRRYIELIKVTTALRYPRLSAETLLLEMHINELEKLSIGDVG